MTSAIASFDSIIEPSTLCSASLSCGGVRSPRPPPPPPPPPPNWPGCAASPRAAHSSGAKDGSSGNALPDGTMLTGAGLSVRVGRECQQPPTGPENARPDLGYDGRRYGSASPGGS